jgi:hypothetical protein
MPAITATALTGSGQRTMTKTTLNGTDSFVYSAGAILVLENSSGGPLSPTIVGADATTTAVKGYGDLDVSGGYAVGSIADGVTKVIPLDSIAAYLVGVLSITSATGITASLLTK